MSEFRYPHRVAAARGQMVAPIVKDEVALPPIDALVVSHVENARYLSGFTGSNALVVLTPDDALFFTDTRYDLQSQTEAAGFERIVLAPGAIMADAVADELKKRGLKSVGFEAAHITYNAFEAMKKAVGDGVELRPRADLIEKVRLVKDADEIAAIRVAVAIADECFGFMQTTVRPGLTEKQVAWEMEQFMRGAKGAHKLSFESIVGAGPNAALIHGRPSDRVLGSSGGPEFVLCDFGCELGGYCSDITRTVVVGGAPTDRMRALYNDVLATLEMSLALIKPGVAGKDIDAKAREFLKARGHGDLQHGLGHSLGRVVHDGQMFGQRSETILAPGMVGTVEPGVYLEGFGGVRIEEDILVTETGCETLTRSTRQLLALG